MSEVRPPPLRALDDFLLGPARLAAPDPRDPQRWRNRVLNNLLYYQSNYGLGLGLALLLGGYFRPLHTLLSSSTVTLVFVTFVWAAENKAPIRRFRRSYPSASLLAMLGSAYGLVSLLGGSEVFLLTVALPISREETLENSKNLEKHFLRDPGVFSSIVDRKLIWDSLLTHTYCGGRVVRGRKNPGEILQNLEKQFYKDPGSPW
ncbi:PRA1 family protein 2 isoform X1 [Gopherus evgoodei]|uniref:PRA1 family protein 2 isoform X1 n=1 Tax=Gopherus evgoodei TaxID=1825980 RepID=UPI0011CEE552|nr:PRA1 family protein 2 isoform X1 [Gopherus evgoodei]